MLINKNKVLFAIEDCIAKGEVNFAVFPYGNWGAATKKILNEVYHIEEIARIDNKLSKELHETISCEEANDIDISFTLLFVSDNKQYRDELLSCAKKIRNAKLYDVASVNIAKRFYFNLEAPKLNIVECNDMQKEVIFNMTKNTWEELGKEEPFWSVLTSEEYLIGNMDKEKKEQFYSTGKSNCVQVVKTLLRNDIIRNADQTHNMDIVEIGCGTGRITKSFADSFHRVYAYDISSGNLKIAKQMIENRNVEFSLVQKIEDYDHLPHADVIYSVIVLQHNTPPVIGYIINAMFRAIKNNGVCIFQIPTYNESYSFEYNEYTSQSENKMEMHIFPQKKVFEIAQKNHCIPMEVYQDDWTGNDDFSTTFVFLKCEENWE